MKDNGIQLQLKNADFNIDYSVQASSHERDDNKGIRSYLSCAIRDTIHKTNFALNSIMLDHTLQQGLKLRMHLGCLELRDSKFCEFMNIERVFRYDRINLLK